jgi:hypothetical protein
MTRKDEFCFLAYNAVWSSGSQETFRGNISLQSPWSKRKTRKKSAWNRLQSSACCLLHISFTLRPWRLKRYVVPKLAGLHGVISETIVLFIVTVVRTSDPAEHTSLLYRCVRKSTVICLFNDAVSISRYRASMIGRLVNSELEGMGKDAVMA